MLTRAGFARTRLVSVMRSGVYLRRGLQEVPVQLDGGGARMGKGGGQVVRTYRGAPLVNMSVLEYAALLRPRSH